MTDPRTSRGIQNALGFSDSNLAWVVNAYILMFGGLLLLGGGSGDLLGRRRIFITGMLIFAGASLLGGFATGFLVTAAIGLLALIIAPTAIRVTREDLSGVDPLAAHAGSARGE